MNVQKLKSPSSSTWRRHTIGIAAIVAMLVGVSLMWAGPAETLQCEYIAWRLSIVFALWWMAYPEFARLPRWSWLILPGIFCVLVLGRRIIAVIPLLFRLAIGMGPLLIVLWILWLLKPPPPKNKTRSKNR